MGKLEVGKMIGRYAIPLNGKEVKFFNTLLIKAFVACGIDVVIQVKDSEHKTEDPDSWTYGLFAEIKYFVCSIANMTEATRDHNRMNYSPINSMVFQLKKERGLSSYEKLQALDSSLHHYPAVKPYCDITAFSVDTSTSGSYRRYRGRLRIHYDGGKIGHMYGLYNTSLIDPEFIAGVTEFIFDTCRNKAHYPDTTVEAFTKAFLADYSNILD